MDCERDADNELEDQGNNKKYKQLLRISLGNQRARIVKKTFGKESRAVYRCCEKTK